MGTASQYSRPTGGLFIPWATAAVVLAAVAVFSIQFIFGMATYQWVRVALTLFPVEWYLAPDGPDFLNSKWALYFVGLFGYPLNHGGWQHLANNSFPVILCGYFVERRFVEGGLGRSRYLAFLWSFGVLVGVVVNIWTTTHIDALGREAFGRGMSGIGFGLIGAMLTVGGKPPLSVSLVAIWVIGVFANEMVAISDERLLSQPIVSHLAGLIAGVALGGAARIWLQKSKGTPGAQPGTSPTMRLGSDR